MINIHSEHDVNCDGIDRFTMCCYTLTTSGDAPGALLHTHISLTFLHLLMAAARSGVSITSN